MTADEATIQTALARVRQTLDALSIPLPAAGFWPILEAEIRSALERNDEREDPVRVAIERWVGKKALRNPNFFVDHSLQTHEDVAIQISFQYRKESRAIATAYEPYHRQEAQGTLEGLWDRTTKNRFVEETLRWRRAGVGQVIACNRCGRTGKTRCGECRGVGSRSLQCARCKGKGEIERQDKIVGGSVGGKKGSAGAGVILRKDDCRPCGGTGQVKETCAVCHGGREITCDACQGTRDLWDHEVIEARVTVPTATIEVRPDPDLESKWVVDIVRSRSLGVIQHEAASDGSANQDRQLAAAFSGGRLLFERIESRVVPVTVATFDWKGRPHKVFLIDGEIRSLAPTAFRSAKRVALLYAVLVAGLLAVGRWAATSYYSDPEPGVLSEPPPAPREWAIVNTVAANVRNGSSAQSEVLGQVLQGDSLEILGPATSGWLPVRFLDATGYISRDLVLETRP